jgi:surfactin synthase thioesterase subunit
MARWSDLTSLPLVQRELAGDHFYIQTERDDLLSVLADTLLHAQSEAAVRDRRAGD